MKEPVGNCPYCGGIVLKVLTGEVGDHPPVVRVSCGNCKKPVVVSLGISVKVEPILEKT